MDSRTSYDESRRSYIHTLDGREVGRIDAVDGGDGIESWVHTEVLPELRGRGHGERLVKGALAIARTRGARVRPVCPYVRAYARRHPEWRDVFVD